MSTVSKTFKQWETEKRQQLQIASTSSATLRNKITSLPPRNPHFSGREDVLIQLNELLTNKDDNEQKFDEKIKNNHLQTICGVDGVGKSELALEFAYRNQEKYEFIRWFNATNPKILQNEFEKFAELLAIDVKLQLESNSSTQDIILQVHAKLKKVDRWLLIFDDAITSNEISPYIPSVIDSNNQHILVTSQNNNWESQLQLGVFNHDDAFKFVQSRLPQETVDDAKQLYELLALSPLALSHSLAFLQQQSPNMTIQKYIDIFQTKNYIGLAEISGDNEEKRIQNIVMKTLLISIDSFVEQHSRSVELLSLSAYLNPAGISQELMEELIGKENETKQNGGEIVHTKDFAKEIENELTILYQYALIDSSNIIGEFKVHRVIQSLVRERDGVILVGSSQDQSIELIVNNRFKLIKDTLISMYPCDKVTEDDFDYAVTISKQMITLSSTLIELQKSYLHLGNELNNTIRIMIADLTFCLADLLAGLHDVQNQKVLLEEALRIYEEVYGPNHFQVANTLINLGNVHEDLGDVETKKLVLERALKINEQCFGSNHAAIVPILTNLGNAYCDLGDVKKQKEFLERALTIFQQECGFDHFAAIPILTNLGNAYGDLGDAKKQKELLENALKLMEKQYGPDHFQIAMILIDLANASSDLGDITKSKELLEQALRINEQYYGIEHVEVARTLTYLGNAYRLLDQTQKAKELLEHSLRIQEQCYGTEHFEVATTLNNLANVYGSLGDFQKSKEQLDRALRIREEYYGPDHYQVAIILVNLGITFGNLDQIEKSIEVSERATKILESVFGSDHFRVAPALAVLGIAKGQLSDLSTKEELLGRALTIFESQYGSSHPRTIFLRTFLLQESHPKGCCILM